MRVQRERRPVLFDIDGTLVDSTDVVERVWTQVAARHGADRHAILAVCHGKRDVDVVSEFFPPDARALVLDEVAELELAVVDGVVAIPGAARVLGAVPPHRWAAVTSGGRALMATRLRTAGLPHPRVLVSADDVRRGKPDPEGYLAAARGLGVDPTSCVVVEDSPTGVGAGLAAGATVAAVTTTHPARELAGAHAVLPDLDALLDIL